MPWNKKDQAQNCQDSIKFLVDYYRLILPLQYIPVLADCSFSILMRSRYSSTGNQCVYLTMVSASRRTIWLYSWKDDREDMIDLLKCLKANCK